MRNYTAQKIYIGIVVLDGDEEWAIGDKAYDTVKNHNILRERDSQWSIILGNAREGAYKY